MNFPFQRLTPFTMGGMTYFPDHVAAKAAAEQFMPKPDEGHSIEVVYSTLGWMIEFSIDTASGECDTLYYCGE